MEPRRTPEIRSSGCSFGAAAQDANPTTEAGTAVAQPRFPVQGIFVNAMHRYSDINVYVNGSNKRDRVVENLKYGTVSESITLTAPTRSSPGCGPSWRRCKHRC